MSSSDVRADAILFTNLDPHRRRYPPPPHNRLIERAHISQSNEQQVDNLDKRSFTARARVLRQVVLGVYRVLSLSLLALVFLGAHFIAHGLSRQLGPNLFEVKAGRLPWLSCWGEAGVGWGGMLYCVVLCCIVCRVGYLQCWVVLCCAVPCSAVLCCAALCCVVYSPCCAISSCASMCCSVLCCALLCCAVLHSVLTAVLQKISRSLRTRWRSASDRPYSRNHSSCLRPHSRTTINTIRRCMT